MTPHRQEYLENVKVQLFDILKQVEPVPGVQIQTGSAADTPAPMQTDAVDPAEAQPDKRHPNMGAEHPAEQYDDKGRAAALQGQQAQLPRHVDRCDEKPCAGDVCNGIPQLQSEY